MRERQDGELAVPGGPLIEQVLTEVGVVIFLELKLMGLNGNLKEHSLP